GSDRAAVGLAVQDQTARDPGAEREHDHVARAPPRADLPLGDRSHVAVVVEGNGDGEPVAHPVAEVEVRQRHVHRADDATDALIDRRGKPEADHADPVDHEIAHDFVKRVEQLVLRLGRRRPLDAPQDRAFAVDDSRRDLRPADVETDGPFCHAATIRRRMAQGEKPYRVYRGGRVKGRVPTLGKPERAPSRTDRPPHRFKGPGPKQPKPKREWSGGRYVAIALSAFLVLVLVWGVASYLSLRSGAKAANKRLPASAKAALVPQSGLIPTNPSVILLLGTDHSSKIRDRNSFERSDSIMLLRTDPGKGRLNYLSIPRDLRVNVPGRGYEKINSAFQLGGPALAIKTVRAFTDVEVNHVVVVDFDAFTKVIDQVGGVDINVPGPILSNKFDCPYSTQARCDRWQGWRFAKGMQHMNGQRARVYSRIRENKLNPRESDATRTERQQAVIQALLAKLTSLGVMVKLPWVGDDVMKPLTTDLTAGQMMQLALVKKRSGNQLHCRLGGTPAGFGGGYLQPDEEARRTIAAFLGRSAPQPPLPGSAYGSGCL